MTVRTVVLCMALSMTAACTARHHEPVIDTGPKPPNITGTISGKVTADSAVFISGRVVTATDEAGKAYSATTSQEGGYTMQVPANHHYRLSVELRPGERVVKQPETTNVNPSDLDAGLDFVISAAR